MLFFNRTLKMIEIGYKEKILTINFKIQWRIISINYRIFKSMRLQQWYLKELKNDHYFVNNFLFKSNTIGLSAFLIVGLKFNRHSDDTDDNENLSHSFVTSVLVAILCFVLLYLILHNKNKVKTIHISIRWDGMFFV